jgi:hypothetical protein
VQGDSVWSSTPSSPFRWYFSQLCVCGSDWTAGH